MTNKENLGSWLSLYRESLKDYKLIQSVITSNIISTKAAYDMGEYEFARKFKYNRVNLNYKLKVIESNLKNCKASIKRYGRLYSIECEMAANKKDNGFK